MVLGNGTWGWGTVWTVPMEPLKLLETFRRALASANRARPLLRSVSGLEGRVVCAFAAAALLDWRPRKAIIIRGP